MELAASWDSSLNFPSPFLRYFLQDFLKEGHGAASKPTVGVSGQGQFGLRDFYLC